MVEVPAAALVARRHRLRRYRMGHEPHPPRLEQVRARRVIKMRVRQNTIADRVRRQAPIRHIREDLIHRVATAAVEQIRPSPVSEYTYSILVTRVHAVKRHPVQIAAHLVQAP